MYLLMLDSYADTRGQQHERSRDWIRISSP